MKKNIYILTITIFISSVAASQKTEEIIRAGNELYKKGDFSNAEKEFEKAASDQRARFNLANAQYKQDKKNEAEVVFTDIGINGDKDDIRSRSYYNKGVILTGQKKLEESIEAYKNTLRIDPTDKEARENLQKALLEWKKKNPPKKDEKKKNPPRKQPPQPKLNQKQTEQKLKQLQQKEKETQQKIQQKRPVSLQPKDW